MENYKMNRIKECSNVYSLASRLNLSTASLTKIIYHDKVDNCYKQFSIPKKNGGIRTICAPNKELKNIQKRLANALYYELKMIREEWDIIPKISHAFEKKKSIISNCEIHKRKRFILNVDLEDFFDHFHYGRVYGYFSKNKYFLCEDEVARTIANLACYKGRLPQGAPTSPIITNLIFQAVDSRILKLTREFRLDYTRYADDLTFSTNRKDFEELYPEFLEKLSKLLERSGFEINQNKIRLSCRGSRQTVTGLIVNNKINVSSDYFRTVRAYAHSFYKTGSFQIKDKNGSVIKEGTANQLEGMLSFIRMIDRHNNNIIHKDAIKQYRSLNKRDREYQRLLFFRLFYRNDKPLIITEGKTDPIYLRCALKKHYQQFPELIEKTSSGFRLKVQFLKKSRRIHEFFSLVRDGADTMSIFYKNYYLSKAVSDDKKSDTEAKESTSPIPDYYQYFSSITGSPAANPVLLIFDNELNNKSKPLHHFMNAVGSKNKAVLSDELTQKGWFRVTPERNLYIVTNPLVDDKEECEIEELFTADVLNLESDNKTFSLKKDYDINKHFGKNIFSKIIARDYQQIDFSRFIPFLERICDAISDYSGTSE